MKAIFAQRRAHDNHTGVVAADVETVTLQVVPETAYWSHGLVVAELLISAEVAGLGLAAGMVVDHYSEPTRDFSVY